jgi:primosomal protein N' (replication factor Y)
LLFLKIDLGEHGSAAQRVWVNVRVLIDGPSELVFDYAVPAGMQVCPGCRVRVPLRQKSATGTVLDVVEADDMGFALRELSALLDPEPLITGVLLKIGRWMADYYACGFETVIRSLLPESVRSEENSAKTRRMAVLEGLPSDEVMEKMARKAPRQHVILSLLMHAEDQRMAVADLGQGAAASLKGLEKNGLLRIEQEEVRRDPEADGLVEILESKPLVLNEVHDGR